MTPFIAEGRSPIQWRKGTLPAKKSMFEMIPTKADGIDQNMMAAATAPMTTNRRMMRSHHFMRKELHTISCGRMPMKRGDM